MKKLIALSLFAIVFAAACSKPSADEHLAKADDYMSKSMTAEAIVEYKLAVQADAKRGDARLKLADALLKNNDARGAIGEYIRAADLLPDNADAQVKAGGMLLLARAFEDAKARAEKALAIDPKSVDGMILMGNALAGLKDLDGALKEYQEAIALNPSQDAAYANIGAIQFSKGQRAEAEATFKKAVQESPKSLRARLALANFYWAAERQADAETEFKTALQMDAQNLEAHRALGMFFMATNRAELAEPHFKAIADSAGNTDTTIALADYYLVTKRPDQAKQILRDLAQKTDGFAPATLRLAAVEAAQNNRPVAHSLVESVIAKTPTYMPARSMKMRLLLADGKTAEARTTAEAITKDDPNSAAAAEAFLALGAIDAARDRNADAQKSFEEALRIDQRSLAAALGLVRLHLSAGALDKADTYARQAMTIAPQSPAARAMMVRVDLARGNTQRANAELAALQKAYPNAPAVLNLVAVSQVAAGKREGARAAYSKVLAAQPGDLEALTGLVMLDVSAGRAKDSVARVDEAMKRTTPDASLLTLAARAHWAAGDLAKAEELLKKAIDTEPDRLMAYGLLGQFYISQKRLPDARDQYTALVARTPRSVPANTMLGMIIEAQGDKAAAEAQYQKTLAVDAEAAVAANNLAWIWVSSVRNLDQALQLAQTAFKYLPESPQVLDTLGWAYYKKGMAPQAVRHLELSVQKDAGDPAAHYHLGMAYLEAGEVDKAKKSLQKALSMSQSFEGATEAKKALADLGR